MCVSTIVEDISMDVVQKKKMIKIKYGKAICMQLSYILCSWYKG